MSHPRSQVMLETELFEAKCRSASKGCEPAISEQLARLLGCPYVGGRFSELTVMYPGLPKHDITNARECLLRILTLCAYGSGAMSGLPPLLIGLHQHGMLRETVEKESGARILAVALLLYVQAHWDEDLLDVAAAPVVVDLLNAWIAPAERWTNLPRHLDVATHLFGNAWTLLDLGNDFYTGVVVAREKPPFLPGLCLEQDRALAESAELPCLGMP